MQTISEYVVLLYKLVYVYIIIAAFLLHIGL